MTDERYRQLVELAPDAIIIHDGDRIVLANAAAARLAGATTWQDLIDLAISVFLDPPYLKAAEAELLRSGRLTDRSLPVRDVFRKLDGSTVEVEVSAIAFMDRGNASVHLVVRDITERLEAERLAQQVEVKLRQAQRMDTVGALAGGVAHEVNNMMTIILGFTHFFLEDPALSDQRQSEAREIAKAAARAATITQQLLAFSRRAHRQPVNIDIGVAVHAIEPILRRVLGENRKLVLHTEGPARIRVDPGQLEQILVNLALNARDAMPGEGTLRIVSHELAVRGSGIDSVGGTIPPGHYARIIVRDDGEGMDSATRERIFEPFFTTKPIGQGTGLGLAAVYGIVRQNGAFVSVSSAPRMGTTFQLYFPIVADSADASPLSVAIKENDQAGKVVLVVEDESVVRAMTTRILEQAGFKVIQASDGLAALELTAPEGPAPDLLLTDLVMPRIGGVHLARRLRSRWPTLPVLFMSGYSTGELSREGADYDGELIQKPFTAGTLVSKVVESLAKAAVAPSGPKESQP